MAFILKSHDIAQGLSIRNDLLMADGEAVTYGEALTFSSGRLSKASGTTAPEYIALTTQAAETSSVTPIAVVHTNEEQLFEVKSSGQIAATAKGSKYTIGTDGLTITTTTTNGVFEVIETDGATTSTVKGYFRR